MALRSEAHSIVEAECPYSLSLGVSWDVDSRSMDSSAVKGIDGWGSCPSSLGNLLLAQAEDGETRFPVVNISREMTIDGGGPGQWRGAPGSRRYCSDASSRW